MSWKNFSSNFKVKMGRITFLSNHKTNKLVLLFLIFFETFTFLTHFPFFKNKQVSVSAVIKQ